MESGKQRRSRIELGYYRKPDDKARLRFRLTTLALIASVCWILVAPIWGTSEITNVHLFQQARLASKGPLSSPHAIWESSCETCHIPGRPIDGTKWSPAFWRSLHASDGRCRTCHAGPPHHANQLERDIPSCAECHREHRGQGASLLAVEDAACTSCHQNLASHRNEGATATSSGRVNSVTRFDLDHHPEFTPSLVVPGSDSVRIKFSHARHMASGLVMEGGGAPRSLADLAPADRARYGGGTGKDQNSPIQLECDSCHQLDGQDYVRGLDRRLAGLVPPRTPGDTMLPVVYENHCVACHPLPFDEKLPKQQVRHGLKIAEIVQDLRRLYASEAVNADPALLRSFVRPQPKPGLPVPREIAEVDKTVTDKVLKAIDLLVGSAVEETVRRQQNLPLGRGGCVECHELKSVSRPLDNLQAASSLEIRPVVSRSLWYEGAVFGHSAHRALKCEECHVDVRQSKDSGRPSLPGMALCVNCHAPAVTSGGLSQGGAGMACVECHRYHDMEHPGRGVGSAARRADELMDLDQFLRGGRTSARPH